MNVGEGRVDVAAIAAAIGEPARARMLFCLMDGQARTSTELAVVGGVTPSTASTHLGRLRERRLVRLVTQGKHRYYSLVGEDVAAALEALSVLAGGPREKSAPQTPVGLRAARTCYDHLAGALGVSLHDRFVALGWLAVGDRSAAYQLTAAGERGFASLGLDVEATRALRRRFAYACLDWSERRPHVGGALGAGVLTVALARRWVVRRLDSRALTVTAAGSRELAKRFGVGVQASPGC